MRAGAQVWRQLTSTLKLPAYSRTEIYAGAAACVLGSVAAVAAAFGGKLAIIAVVGLLAATVGVYIGMRHPLWLYYGTVISVTTLPFGYFPGAHIPIYLVCGCGSMLAFLLHPRAVRRRSPLMSAVMLLILMSAVSMIATFSTPMNIMDFTKWGVATGFMFAALSLPDDELVRLGKAVVYACTFSGAVGIIAVLQGTTKWIYKPFSILGYHAADRFYITGGTMTQPRTGRFDVGQGSESFQRLGGMWADPNAAGVGLVVGISIAAILFVGWQRATLMTILGVAIVLTLSRAAMLSFGGGVALVFIFHNMRARDRRNIVAMLLLAAAAAMSVPAVRTRLLGSLGSNDAGASDRMASLREFPMRLGNHWIFGRGWSLREFKDGPYAFTQNFVSNAYLIAIHRGGLIAGLSFLLVIVIACVVAAKLIRRGSLPHAFYGGTFIAFSVIALNLDHPVVVIAQMTFMYTFFLIFLEYSDELRKAGALDPPKADPVPATLKTKPVTAQAVSLPASAT